DRVHQHRHMTADIMENIGLLQVVELVAATNKAGRRKTPGREEGEEHIVRNESRHCDDAPTGRAIEDVAEPAKIGDAMGRDAQAPQTLEILAASPVLQKVLLALEQEAPNGVFVIAIGVPVLLDRVGRQPAAHRAAPEGAPLQLGTPWRSVNRSSGAI